MVEFIKIMETLKTVKSINVIRRCPLRRERKRERVYLQYWQPRIFNPISGYNHYEHSVLPHELLYLTIKQCLSMYELVLEFSYKVQATL